MTHQPSDCCYAIFTLLLKCLICICFLLFVTLIHTDHRAAQYGREYLRLVIAILQSIDDGCHSAAIPVLARSQHDHRATQYGPEYLRLVSPILQFIGDGCHLAVVPVLVWTQQSLF